MMVRVGLKPTLMDKSSVSATAIATARSPSTPSADDTISILGNASKLNAAITPPMRMKGRRRPPQNHTLSLTMPKMTWPKMPAMGPAAHTKPTSSIFRLYLVVRIQLSAAICTESAKPIAEEGKLRMP